MGKYYGKVGYVVDVETTPGVWIQKPVERTYSGEVIRRSYSWQPVGSQLNDNVNISNQISIIGDPYAFQHFGLIRYVEWMGQMWKVTNVDFDYPRLTLSIGGVYNGEQA